MCRALLGLLLIGGAWRLSAADALSIATDEIKGQIEVRYGAQTLMVYAYASNQFKPYVKALYTLRGDNVLLDSPADHKHHHGLMYAVVVNGVNFWEEANAPGYERSARPPVGTVSINSRGQPQAVILHSIYWVPSSPGHRPHPKSAALLTEQRTLALSVDAATKEVALAWSSEFTAGPGSAHVTLSGTDYDGLGLRFPRSWDRVARHLNSENAPYPTQGRRDVLTAKWSAVANTIDGHPQTVALFARPGENRGPAKFFSMLQPFTYLSATQGLDKAPLEYRAGEKFELRYLVTVYPAIQSREFLQRRYQQWRAR